MQFKKKTENEIFLKHRVFFVEVVKAEWDKGGGRIALGESPRVVLRADI